MTYLRTYWKRATPLSWGIGMSKDDNPIYGANRCLITVDDQGAGPYLQVQFKDEEPGQGESADMGYFCTHEDIDAFCNHLHHALKLANGENE